MLPSISVLLDGEPHQTLSQFKVFEVLLVVGQDIAEVVLESVDLELEPLRVLPFDVEILADELE